MHTSPEGIIVTSYIENVILEKLIELFPTLFSNRN